jgi:hypothetical protein
VSVKRRVKGSFATIAKNLLKPCHYLRSQTLLKRDWLLDSSKLARFIVRHGVTFESHALMQNPYDQHIVQKENHMGPEIHPPQSGGKMPGASTAVWIFRESAEYLFQSVPVASRLFDAELPDSVVGNPGDVGISPF